MVLHTDLAKHFDFVQKLESWQYRGYAAFKEAESHAASFKSVATAGTDANLSTPRSSRADVRPDLLRASSIAGGTKFKSEKPRSVRGEQSLPAKTESRSFAVLADALAGPRQENRKGSGNGVLTLIKGLTGFSMGRSSDEQPKPKWLSPFHDQEGIDVKMMLLTAIKFADLGHVTKVFAVHQKWTMCATHEFWALGDKEKALGVAVSPLCDREKDLNIAKSQLGFFKFVCNPFYDKVADLLQPDAVPFVTLQANYAKWEERSREHNISPSMNA
eukprot:6195889-Pleurochrysis_carterae.AAC.1